MSAYRHRFRRRGHNWPFTILSSLFIAAVVILSFGEYKPETGLPSWSQLYEKTMYDRSVSVSALSASEAGEVSVHFLDTEQSDCILIISDGKSALIDAGAEGMGREIVSYLRAQGVKSLDLVIATHPHADHIGSMAYVLKKLPCSQLLITGAPDELIYPSALYSDVLSAAEKAGVPVVTAQPGLVYELGSASLSILAPVGEYGDLNDWSIVSKLSAGSRSFIFTGDAGTASEADMLAFGTDVDCDVLKLGHHGSNTACSHEFLAAASPEFAVITVGAGNDYGHPHDEVLRRLASMGTKVYRTDLDGTVVAVTDGDAIEFYTQEQGALCA